MKVSDYNIAVDQVGGVRFEVSLENVKDTGPVARYLTRLAEALPGILNASLDHEQIRSVDQIVRPS